MNNLEPTPMMKQYLEAKRDAGDALLLFRMGDFYELFFDDAHTAATALGIAVTTREKNKGADATPMAGFPHHQLESYLAKLISSGFKVAVCEQLEDPKKAKNIVKRKVIRIVTPGTVVDETILDPRQSNFLAAIVALPARVATTTEFLKGKNSHTNTTDKSSADESTATDKNTPSESTDTPDGTCPTAIDGPAGIAWVELSTGQFHAAVLPWTQLIDQIGRIGPSEIILPESLKGILPAWLTEGIMISTRPDWAFSSARSLELLLTQFKVKTLEGFGFKLPLEQRAIQAAGGVLNRFCRIGLADNSILTK
ncbi:MAG: hypothetical protein Q4G59_00805 [Planctomycetia bacterium]|nr:hypothetical protein [Planctomycetia bacterium]